MTEGGHRIDPATLRTIHVIKTESFKALYYDNECRELRPNLVFVQPDGSIAFEINEVGLKGGPLDPDRKLAVVWGDSVVFSLGRGWPCLLDGFAPAYQFLNGGIEGDPYTNILRRAFDFNQCHQVQLNLLMLGWHTFVPNAPQRAGSARLGWLSRAKTPHTHVDRPHPSNQKLEADLTRFLKAVPNTVVLTIPTALNHRIAGLDLSSYLVAGDEQTGFRFLGTRPHHIEKATAQSAAAGSSVQRQGFEYILERNAIARRVCTRLGVRQIDLFASFDTEELVDFREHFLDLIHFRPSSYPLVAQTVYDRIEDLLV